MQAFPVMSAVERLAASDLRSVNAWVECLLCKALKECGIKLAAPQPVKRGRPVMKEEG